MFKFFRKVWDATKAFFRRLFGRAKRMGEKAHAVAKWAVVVAIAAGLLVGGAIAMQGLALALLVVAGMVITMSVIPGLWWFSTTTPGYIFIVLSTAWLTHAILGATLMGIFAMAWALSIKMLVLKIAHYRMAQGETPMPFGEKDVNTVKVKPISVS